MTLNQWLRNGSAAIALSVFLPAGAYAGAAQVKTQSPGYYRMMLGDFEVTALCDGTVALPVSKFLTNIRSDKVQKSLTRAYLKDPVETSVNGYRWSAQVARDGQC